jgi:hypothetical protein
LCKALVDTSQMRVFMAAFLIGVLFVTSLGQTKLAQWKQLQCTGRTVSNRYVNYAEGFSVAIPKPLKGRAGQAAGPERGVAVPLSDDCAGVVIVFGEPNSTEWATPADAITWKVQSHTEDNPQAVVQRYRNRLRNLKAAGVTIHHPATSDVGEIVVAFRPGGGPVYTVYLATTEVRYNQDRKSLIKVLRGFRLEPWW